MLPDAHGVSRVCPQFQIRIRVGQLALPPPLRVAKIFLNVALSSSFCSLSSCSPRLLLLLFLPMFLFCLSRRHRTWEKRGVTTPCDESRLTPDFLSTAEWDEIYAKSTKVRDAFPCAFFGGGYFAPTEEKRGTVAFGQWHHPWPARIDRVSLSPRSTQTTMAFCRYHRTSDKARMRTGGKCSLLKPPFAFEGDECTVNV